MQPRLPSQWLCLLCACQADHPAHHMKCTAHATCRWQHGATPCKHSASACPHLTQNLTHWAYNLTHTGLQADTVTVKLQPSEEQARLGTSELQEASLPIQPSSPQPPNGHPPPSGHSHRRNGDGDDRGPSSNGRAKDREKDSEKDKKERKHRDKQAKKEAKRAKEARRRAEQSSSASEGEPADGSQLGEAAGGHAHSHEPPWLAPHIAVKILDKRVKGGRCGPPGSFSQCLGLWHASRDLTCIRLLAGCTVSFRRCMHAYAWVQSPGIN